MIFMALKGPSHLWSSFLVGPLVEQFWALSRRGLLIWWCGGSMTIVVLGFHLMLKIEQPWPWSACSSVASQNHWQPLLRKSKGVLHPYMQGAAWSQAQMACSTWRNGLVCYSWTPWGGNQLAQSSCQWFMMIQRYALISWFVHWFGGDMLWTEWFWFLSQPVPPEIGSGPREPDLAQPLGWALSHQCQAHTRKRFMGVSYLIF